MYGYVRNGGPTADSHGSDEVSARAGAGSEWVGPDGAEHGSSRRGSSGRGRGAQRAAGRRHVRGPVPVRPVAISASDRSGPRLRPAVRVGVGARERAVLGSAAAPRPARVLERGSAGRTLPRPTSGQLRLRRAVAVVAVMVLAAAAVVALGLLADVVVASRGSAVHHRAGITGGPGAAAVAGGAGRASGVGRP